MSTRAIYIASFAIAATLHILIAAAAEQGVHKNRADAGRAATTHVIEVNLLVSQAPAATPAAAGHAGSAMHRKTAPNAQPAAHASATPRATAGPRAAASPPATQMRTDMPAAPGKPEPTRITSAATDGNASGRAPADRMTAYAAPAPGIAAAAATVAYSTMGNRFKPPSPYGPIDPGYPAAARRRGWQGTVTVQADISATGTVTNVTVIDSSGHEILDSAALHAVAQTRFRPATSDSTPVGSEVVVPFRFTLSQSK